MHLTLIHNTFSKSGSSREEVSITTGIVFKFLVVFNGLQYFYAVHPGHFNVSNIAAGFSLFCFDISPHQQISMASKPSFSGV